MPKRAREAKDSNAAEVGNEREERTTETRKIPPAHYAFKIEYFSLLSTNEITMYETNEFEVGDQKWQLILYPNGDRSRKGEDHMFLYLAVSEANPLKVGWEINATVRFFVFDPIRDEYLAKEGTTLASYIAGKNWRFHAMKSKWGIPRFMPLKNFINPPTGYLVFVEKSSGLGECLTLKASPKSVSHEWKISKFSTLVNDCYSEVFTAGSHEWKLHLCPRGDEHNRDKNISMYLRLVDSGDQKVLIGSSVQVKSVVGLLLAAENCSRLLGDECVMKADVKVLGTASKLP
ncbi:hypothetical protein EUGRSUZ_K00597 [Eucalyptus grandis]|uniref:Uncharacterized protein n=2 Tax=Eucalyptus grandis TaxID=71139 RepID=A0ACC3ISB2_EUCGR|nr:hypothetical protein EUGRSUZ_K00597 [Eucalyptus grandis]